MIYVITLILFLVGGRNFLKKLFEETRKMSWKNISRSMLNCTCTFWEKNGEEKTKNEEVYSTAKAKKATVLLTKK
jgi:hypothetical protein